MRILIVAYYFPPYMNVGGFRPMSWARRLHDRGHEVIVIRGDGQEADSCAYFHESLDRPLKTIRVHNPMLQEAAPDAPRDGGRTSPSPTALDFIKEKIKSRIPMVDSYGLWARGAIAAAMKEIRSGGSFDAVISTSFPLSAHEVARAVKKRTGCAWIADFRDFFGQFDSNALDPRSPRGKFLGRRFAAYGLEADLVLTVSEKLKTLVDRALGGKGSMVLYNGYFEEHLPDPAGRTTEWRIFYSGSFNETEFTVEPLVRALAAWPASLGPRPEPVFTGSPIPSVSEAFRTIGMDVRFLGRLDNRETLRWQAESAFLLICDAMSGPGALLTKTFEYLAMRRPVIAISRPGSDLRTGLFAQKAPGYCLSTEPAEILAFLEDWKDRQTTDRTKAFYPPETIRQYSREQQADLLADRIEAMVSARRARLAGDTR